MTASTAWQVQHPDHNDTPLDSHEEIESYLDKHNISLDTTKVELVHMHKFDSYDPIEEGDSCPFEECEGEYQCTLEESIDVPETTVRRRFTCSHCGHEDNAFLAATEGE